MTYDDISPVDFVVNDTPFRAVLMDAVTRTVNSIPIDFPASVPSFTQYYGAVTGDDPFGSGSGTKWVGTYRVIRGNVKRAGSKFRYRVEQVSVVMR